MHLRGTCSIFFLSSFTFQSRSNFCHELAKKKKPSRLNPSLPAIHSFLLFLPFLPSLPAIYSILLFLPSLPSFPFTQSFPSFPSCHLLDPTFPSCHLLNPSLPYLPSLPSIPSLPFVSAPLPCTRLVSATLPLLLFSSRMLQANEPLSCHRS